MKDSKDEIGFLYGGIGTLFVCVNQIKEHKASGYFYSPYIQKKKYFENFIQMYTMADRMVRRLEQWQRISTKQWMYPEEKWFPAKPKKCFFAIRILSLEQNTWHGTLRYSGGKQNLHFKSSIEMLRKMNEILGLTSRA